MPPSDLIQCDTRLLNIQSREMEKVLQAYKVARNNAVRKLQNTDHDQEGHEGVHQLHPLCCLVYVASPDSNRNVLCI